MQKRYKIHDATIRITGNYNTHNVQFSRNNGNKTTTFGHLIEYNMRNIIPEKPYTK